MPWEEFRRKWANMPRPEPPKGRRPPKVRDAALARVRDRYTQTTGTPPDAPGYPRTDETERKA